jgi:hypothetical protein
MATCMAAMKRYLTIPDPDDDGMTVSSAELVLRAAMDPALGPDRLVRLGDIHGESVVRREKKIGYIDEPGEGRYHYFGASFDSSLKLHEDAYDKLGRPQEIIVLVFRDSSEEEAFESDTPVLRDGVYDMLGNKIEIHDRIVAYELSDAMFTGIVKRTTRRESDHNGSLSEVVLDSGMVLLARLTVNLTKLYGF